MVSGGSRPSDKLFSALWASVWPKNKGGLPWIPWMKVEKGACGLKTKLLLLKVTLRDSLHPECAEQLVQNNWWLAVEALVDGS